MSQKTWLGGLAALPTQTPVAQVWTTTVNNAVNGDTYQVVFTNEAGATFTVSYTASVGTDTTTTIAASLASAINSSTIPSAKAVTAASSLAVLTLTAKTAGVPFYAATAGTGGFTATSTTTASQGGNDWNTAGNWAENAIPAGGDNVLITGSNAIKYGLATGLTLGGFSTQPNSSVAIGAPGTPLSFVCTSFYWANTGIGWLNIGSSAISCRVSQTAQANAPDCGLYLLGSGITTLYIEGGSSVDLASTPGQTATVTTVQLVGSSPRVRAGAGLTLTAFNADSPANGTELGCACTTATICGGNVLTTGTGTIGTLNVNGGTVVGKSTGTITAANINATGSLDMTQSQVARTITTANLARGGKLLYDPADVTIGTLVPSGPGPVALSVA